MFWPTAHACARRSAKTKPPIAAFSFWPGLSPPGSGRTLGCTCTHTSSRAHSSSPGHQGPAEGGSLPASCRQRDNDTEPWKQGCSHVQIMQCQSSFQMRCSAILHIRNKSSLCGGESQLEVFPGLVGVEDWVLERIGEEPVHQGAEGNAVFPARREVLDAHSLFHSRGESG